MTTPRGSAGEVFGAFLKLGLTSFGGPIAHLGYFRDELVLRRRWIDEAGYADLVALCQFLPGPASSQVGFALGLTRAGPLGALAAWIGFTAPSALLMIAFAYGAKALSGEIGALLTHGLKLAAMAIVAQAAFGMARSLAPDLPRAAIAICAALIALSGPTGQIAAIALGAGAGWMVCRADGSPRPKIPSTGASRAAGAVCLLLFFGLLAGSPLLRAATGAQGVAMFDAFYRSGALVFGGGHVVLPLLQAETVQTGWISGGDFLAGYGAAQAVPGPLFSFAAYLGAAVTPPPNGLLGAALALFAIFLPGFLILVGALPFWSGFREKAAARAAMRGANAAVVGVLAAALIHPIGTGAIAGPADIVLVACGFAALAAARLPPIIVVASLAAAAALIGRF